MRVIPRFDRRYTGRRPNLTAVGLISVFENDGYKPPKDVPHTLGDRSRKLRDCTERLVELLSQAEITRRHDGTENGSVKRKETRVQEGNPFPK